MINQDQAAIALSELRSALINVQGRCDNSLVCQNTRVNSKSEINVPILHIHRIVHLF